ncbi:hypothetical protein TNCV_3126301 [Trichonephila clavipes]|nr:hypothetical protein TNCV_3126301 [Trichonephila clavipes]
MVGEKQLNSAAGAKQLTSVPPAIVESAIIIYWRPAQPPGVGGAIEKLFCSHLRPAAPDGGLNLAWLTWRGNSSHINSRETVAPPLTDRTIFSNGQVSEL